MAIFGNFNMVRFEQMENLDSPNTQFLSSLVKDDWGPSVICVYIVLLYNILKIIWMTYGNQWLLIS